MTPPPNWQEQIDEAFCRAIAIDGTSERREFLETLEKSLRQEVAALVLAHEASDDDFLAPTHLSSVEFSHGTIPLKQQLGPYRIIRKIGEGGMGVVYLASRSEPVRREVALKVVRSTLKSEQILARFQAEQQAMALMDHPGIATAYDAGMTEDGHFFLAMEYCRGKPITAYCNENQSTIRERLELFIQVCHAIQHAHHKGVIHRDIKPSNILVGDDPQQAAIVKVIDFGLAKAINSRSRLTDESLHTEHGQVLGTLRYMSPEQAGTEPDLDARTDVYSLGVLLYELLTGQTPVSAENTTETNLPHLLETICHKSARQPSTLVQSLSTAADIAAARRLSTRELVSSLRGDLDCIVLKALEKSRSRRYQTPDALADDCRRFLALQPIEARPPSFGYQLSRLVQRHRTQFLSATLAVLSLLTAVCFSSWIAWHNYQLRTNAESAREAADSARIALIEASRLSLERLGKTQQILDRLEYRDRPEMAPLKQVLRESVFDGAKDWFEFSDNTDDRRAIAGMLVDIIEMQIKEYAARRENNNSESGAGKSPAEAYSEFAAELDQVARALGPPKTDDDFAILIKKELLVGQLARELGRTDDFIQAAEAALFCLNALSEKTRDRHPELVLEAYLLQARVAYAQQDSLQSHLKAKEGMVLCDRFLEDYPESRPLLYAKAQLLNILGLTLHKGGLRVVPDVDNYPPKEFSVPVKDDLVGLTRILVFYDDAERLLDQLRLDSQMRADAERFMTVVCSNRLMTERNLAGRQPEAFSGLGQRTMAKAMEASRSRLAGAPDSPVRITDHTRLLMNCADYLELREIEQRLEFRQEAYDLLSPNYLEFSAESEFGQQFRWTCLRLARDRCLADHYEEARRLSLQVYDYSPELYPNAPDSELFVYELLRQDAANRGDVTAEKTFREGLLKVLRKFPRGGSSLFLNCFAEHSLADTAQEVPEIRQEFERIGIRRSSRESRSASDR